MPKRKVTLHASIASGSLGSARQRSFRWRTSAPAGPVTVRKIKPATA